MYVYYSIAPLRDHLTDPVLVVMETLLLVSELQGSKLYPELAAPFVSVDYQRQQLHQTAALAAYQLPELDLPFAADPPELDLPSDAAPSLDAYQKVGPSSLKIMKQSHAYLRLITCVYACLTLQHMGRCH